MANEELALGINERLAMGRETMARLDERARTNERELGKLQVQVEVLTAKVSRLYIVIAFAAGAGGLGGAFLTKLLG